MARDRLPTNLLSRAAATARVAAHVGRAGARRLVSRSADDDAAFGDALVGELDHLKGLAMKVGQILSYLDVGLPEATARRLAALQHGLTPLSADVIASRIQEELGAPIDALFDAFDLDHVVAAASIGQVHRAVVRGQQVAVKVQYPGVRDTLDADTRQMRAIAGIASLATAVDGHALVAELRDRLLEECDYRLEAERQKLFTRLLADEPRVTVPAVVDDRCAAGVLTTAWCEGERFEAVVASRQERRSAVAATLASLPWRTLFAHGVLHADPHPGNFLFPADDRIVLLDFGCVKQVPDRDVRAFGALVRAVLDGERALLSDVAGDVGLLGHPDQIDYGELWDMLCWMFAPYRAERFRFDRAYWDEGLRFSRPGAHNARHLSFPPTWLWLQRTLFGLHAVLVRLGAEGPFAPIARAALDARSAGGAAPAAVA